MRRPTGTGTNIPHLTPYLPALLTRHPWPREFVYFAFKQAWACIFGGLLLLGLLVTGLWFPDIGVPRYDFLFLYALAIQGCLLLFRLESWRELGVILLFHLMATAWYLLMQLSFILVYALRQLEARLHLKAPGSLH